MQVKQNLTESYQKTIAQELGISKKCSFFPSSNCINTAIWMHYMDTN